MNTEERESWLMAIQEELENHQSLQTFKYVPARPNMRLLTGGWVFSIKTDQTGQHTRFKARLFVRGCAQPGGTYGVTSSPVAPVLMMRLMVAQAAKDGWNLAHVDFKAAYLNAPVRETIYMQPVAGMNAPPGSVCQKRLFESQTVTRPELALFIDFPDHWDPCPRNVCFKAKP